MMGKTDELANDFLGFLFHDMSAILSDPRRALWASVIGFFIQLLFPLDAFGAWLLLTFGLSAIFLAFFAAFGEKRAENEEKADKKVPYVGDLILLPSRKAREDAAFNMRGVALMIALVNMGLFLFLLIVEALRLAGVHFK
jgi:hypothetical protein